MSQKVKSKRCVFVQRNSREFGAELLLSVMETENPDNIKSQELKRLK